MKSYSLTAVILTAHSASAGTYFQGFGDLKDKAVRKKFGNYEVIGVDGVYDIVKGGILNEYGYLNGYDYGQSWLMKFYFHQLPHDLDYCWINPCQTVCPPGPIPQGGSYEIDHYIQARKKRSPQAESEPENDDASYEYYYDASPEGESDDYEKNCHASILHPEFNFCVNPMTGEPIDWENDGPEINSFDGFRLGDADHIPDWINGASAYNYQGCQWPYVYENIEGEADPKWEEFGDMKWQRVTQDCHGNPLPADVPFYKPLNGWNTTLPHGQDYMVYAKANSAYHFATGPNMRPNMQGGIGFSGVKEGAMFTYHEAHDYCNTLRDVEGIAGTHLWCPGNIAENHGVWMSHPHQPFKKWAHQFYEDSYLDPDTGAQLYTIHGMWLGIFREQSMNESSIYYCGQNRTFHWYQQIYNNWRWREGGPAKRPEPGIEDCMRSYAEDYIIQRTATSLWEDWCWHSPPYHYKRTFYDRNFDPVDKWPRGAAVCEMNCDLVTAEIEPYKPEVPSDCATECEELCYKGECICENCWKEPRVDIGPNGEPAGSTCKDKSEKEIDVPVDDPIPDILHECPDEEGPTPEEIEEIKLHGCHCVKLGALTNFIEMFGGLGKVDEIDSNCGKWHNQRRCVFLPGGQCEGRDDVLNNEVQYKIGINFIHGTINCDLNHDGCLHALCTIDGHYTLEILANIKWIKEFGGGNFTAHISEIDECPRCETCLPPTSCYGEPPFLKFDKGYVEELKAQQGL